MDNIIKFVETANRMVMTTSMHNNGMLVYTTQSYTIVDSLTQ